MNSDTRHTARGEPGPELARRPLLMWFLATRPAFLTVTAVGVIVGWASASYDGFALRPLAALATLGLALLTHAAVNVINDWADALSGTDDANFERIYPFTGGSRFIQNGILSRAQALGFAIALFSAVALGGLALVLWSGPTLLWIGAIGLVLGWGYSAPPLALNSRGLGELCVVAGFALVAIGADCVQRGSIAATPVWGATSYSLLVANLLYVNQFPDRSADRAAGKLHWVARLPVHTARWGYVVLLASSGIVLVAGASSGPLPDRVVWTAPAYVLGAFAALRVLKHAASPARLAPAIVLTIATALLQGMLLALALWTTGSE